MNKYFDFVFENPQKLPLQWTGSINRHSCGFKWIVITISCKILNFYFWKFYLSLQNIEYALMHKFIKIPSPLFPVSHIKEFLFR